jgi:hypothetical protein
MNPNLRLVGLHVLCLNTLPQLQRFTRDRAEWQAECE